MMAAKNNKAKALEILEGKPIQIPQNLKQQHEAQKETKLESPIHENIIDIPQEEVQINDHVIDIGEYFLELKCKSTLLEYVGATDCIKDKVSNC